MFEEGRESSGLVTRRNLLKAAGAAGLVLVLGPGVAACASDEEASTSQEEGTEASDEARRLVILHTNDFHGHLQPWREWQGEYEGKMRGGLAHLATAITQARQEAEEGGAGVLVLDAGDATGDTLIQDLTEGEAMVGTMSSMGYDAMAVGNHEPDFGPDRLREVAGETDFSILTANVLGGGGEPAFEPYVIKEVNGLKVGILGLGYHNTAKTSSPQNVEGLEFGLGTDAARRWVPEIREGGVDVLVALSHQGLSVDQETARQVEGIDLIVGGHSHNRIEEPIVENGVPIVQAGAHGSDLGRLELTVVQDGEVSVVRGGLQPILVATFPADPEVEARIAELESPHREELDEVVGQAEGEIERAQTIAPGEPEPRNQESPADSLFADILRERMESDVAFLPGIGYGVAIPAGPITRAGITQLLPHRSARVWTMKMTGEQIRGVLEQAVTNFSAQENTDRVGGMIQVSGLTFKYDEQAPEGERVWEVLVGDEPLDPDGEYTVAANALLAQGGHEYDDFEDASDREETSQELTGLTVGYLQESGPVSTPPLGRIEQASRS